MYIRSERRSREICAGHLVKLQTNREGALMTGYEISMVIVSRIHREVIAQGLENLGIVPSRNSGALAKEMPEGPSALDRGRQVLGESVTI